MSKIISIEEFLKSKVETYFEEHKNSIKEYAELVRAETLKVAAQEASCEDAGGVDSNGESYEEYQVNKQSILDLVTHPNLEIL